MRWYVLILPLFVSTAHAASGLKPQTVNLVREFVSKHPSTQRILVYGKRNLGSWTIDVVPGFAANKSNGELVGTLTVQKKKSSPQKIARDLRDLLRRYAKTSRRKAFAIVIRTDDRDFLGSYMRNGRETPVVHRTTQKQSDVIPWSQELGLPKYIQTELDKAWRD